MRALLASHNQSLYAVTINSEADIADLIREEHLETLCAADHRLDFWITPSLRATRCINAPATKILFATTTFGARSAPLLRGDVLVATHDRHGRLCGLTEEQITWLAGLQYALPHWVAAVIDRRIRRTQRADRRRRQAERAHQLKHWKPPLPKQLW